MAKKLDLRWREEAFVVKDVAGFYRKLLPIVVKVRDGYYGIGEDETYSQDDMFFITGLQQQKRVALSTDSQTNATNLSFPCDSDILFRVWDMMNKKFSSNPETLEQIDKRIELQEGMLLLPHNTDQVNFKGVANEVNGNITLGEMKVKRVFKQEYLTGFNLPDIHQPYDMSITFPVHMDLKLYVAESLLNGGTAADFKQYLGHLCDKTNHFVNKSKVNGISEILQYQDDIDEEDPYEYLSPMDYIRVTEWLHSRTGDEVYVKPRTSAQSPAVRPQRSIRRPAPEPESSDEDSDTEPKQVRNRKKSGPPPPTKPKPDMHKRSMSLESTSPPVKNKNSRASVIDRARSIDFKRSTSNSGNTNQETRPTSPPGEDTMYEVSDTIKKYFHNAGKKQKSTSSKSASQDTYEITELKEEPKAISETKGESKSSYKVITNESPKPHPRPRVLPSQTATDDSNKSTNTRPTVFVRPTQMVGPQQRHAALPPVPSESEIQTLPPEPTTAPTEKTGTSGQKDTENSLKKQEEPECEYATFSEIPKDISLLGIRQIAACLKKMNMDRYIDKFADLQVDGALLLALSKEELKDDFGMSPTEVTKINMFAHKQWRPNTR